MRPKTWARRLRCPDLKLELRYPATPQNAREHAALAVETAREEFEVELDYSPASVAQVDDQVESFREEGLTGEEAAETLFVLGCYLGEVMVRHLGARWVATVQSALARVSPWPMVVVLPGGSTWDTIGKVFRRLELGDSEYLPAYLAVARESLSGAL
jgi:hypothetical protein